MEVSALKYSGGIGLHGRSALLRLQSDERLVTLVRRGNTSAFELLVSRYETRLLAFCRHLVGSREDAEDVLQDVMTAAYNAMLADDRPINVRPWLYRIARNRSLNHLRRAQAVGVDSMDIHLSEHGATTADKVDEREAFRLLVGDIRGLPETQRTALVLREMDALSYEMIAEAMETTVPSVKSLLVRARVSLAEAAEARLLTCDDVRTELAEVAEGLLKKPNPLVRRHLKSCSRCETFQTQLKHTNKALAALLPIGPWAIVRKLAITHAGHSAGTSAGAAGSGGAAAAGGSIAFGGGAGGMISAGMGALATKAAAGLAAAVLVTAGAVEVDHASHHHAHVTATASTAVIPASAASRSISAGVSDAAAHAPTVAAAISHRTHAASAKTAHHLSNKALAKAKPPTVGTPTVTTPTATTPTPTTTTAAPPTEPGRTATTTVPTVLPPSEAGTPAAAGTSAPVESTVPTAATGTDTPAATPTTTTPQDGTPTTTTPTTTTADPPTDTTTSTTPTSTTPTATTPVSTTPVSTTTTPVTDPTAPVAGP